MDEVMIYTCTLDDFVMTPAKFWIKEYRSSDRLESHPESLNNPNTFNQSDPLTGSHLLYML